MTQPTLAPKVFGAKKLGDEVRITLPLVHKRYVIAKYIGRGRFTTAFKRGSTVYLYVFFGDMSKQVMSECWDNDHIPKMEYLGKFGSHRQLSVTPMKFDGPVRVYKSEYYDRPTKFALKDLLMALHLSHINAAKKVSGDLIKTKRCGVFNREVIRQAKRSGSVASSIIESLEEIESVARRHGDHYLFDDFRSENLGLDKKGRLIFVDPIFDAEKLYNALLEKRE